MQPSAAPDLLEAVRRAQAIAEATCTAGCAWYHRFYPVLRALGLAATPDRHADFFATTLSDAARSGAHDRILVSGTADSGMWSHVAAAYESRGRVPAITLLDRCPTPLAICGEAAGVDHVVADALDFRPPTPFDLITTHSFLVQFSESDRPTLIRRWSDALRPGGLVVTVTRVDPEGTGCFDAERARAFTEAVLDRAQDIGFDMDPAVLERQADAYAERIESHPPRSVDEVRELFERGGFELDRFDVVDIDGALGSGTGGAGLSRGARYLEIVARRR